MSTLPALSDEVQSIKDIPPSGTITPATEPTLNGEPPLESERVPVAADADNQQKVGGFRFWMIFVAMMVSTFLSALDLTGVATALPTITADLNGGDNFVWVGSAYALSSTAILPLSGSLADIFGRKPIMLICIVFFAVGSAIAGASHNMNMLIAARSKCML